MSATPLHRKALLAGGEHAATQACAGIEPQLPPASPVDRTGAGSRMFETSE